MGAVGQVLYALCSDTGAAMWTFSDPPLNMGTPTVSNGKVYVASGEYWGAGAVYVLDAATGGLLHRWPVTGLRGDPPLVANGLVYILYGTYRYGQPFGIRALDLETGASVWSFSSPVGLNMPGLSEDNRLLYTHGCDSALHALNAATGAQVWAYHAGSYWNQMPPIVSGSVVYWAVSSGLPFWQVQALDASTGTKLWESAPFEGAINISCSAVTGNTLYVGALTALPSSSPRGRLYALDLSNSGQIAWVYPASGWLSAGVTAPIVSGSVVYFLGSYASGSAGYCYAVDASSGALLWQTTAGRGWAGPTVAEGALFYVSEGNPVRVCAYAPATGIIWGRVFSESLDSRNHSYDPGEGVGDAKVAVFSNMTNCWNRLPIKTVSSDSNGVFQIPGLELGQFYEVGVCLYEADLELRQVPLHTDQPNPTVDIEVCQDHLRSWLCPPFPRPDPGTSRTVRYLIDTEDATWVTAIDKALAVWGSVSYEYEGSRVPYLRFESVVHPWEADLVFKKEVLPWPLVAETLPWPGFPYLRKLILFNSRRTFAPQLDYSPSFNYFSVSGFTLWSYVDNSAAIERVRTALHEIGHALGLAHITWIGIEDAYSVMHSNVWGEWPEAEWRWFLSPGDVLAIRDFYGPASGSSLAFTALCPVQISVHDPAGETTSRDSLGIPSSWYTHADQDDDGSPDDTVMIYQPVDGVYTVCVRPRLDAGAGDTFSLYAIGSDGPTAMALDLPVADLPACFRITRYQGKVRFDTCLFEPPVTNSGFALKDGTTVPIKFHLLDCEGNVISEQRNVCLEVTGPNAAGVVTTYLFSLTDGTLRYDASASPPHYVANLNTKTYSVKDGGHYTAVAKEDGAPIGSIGFDVWTSAGTGRGNQPQ